MAILLALLDLRLELLAFGVLLTLQRPSLAPLLLQERVPRRAALPAREVLALPPLLGEKCVPLANVRALELLELLLEVLALVVVAVVVIVVFGLLVGETALTHGAFGRVRRKRAGHGRDRILGLTRCVADAAERGQGDQRREGDDARERKANVSPLPMPPRRADAIRNRGKELGPRLRPVDSRGTLGLPAPESLHCSPS